MSTLLEFPLTSVVLGGDHYCRKVVYYTMGRQVSCRASHPNMFALLNVYFPHKSGIAAHVALGKAWHLGMSDLTNCESLALAMECVQSVGCCLAANMVGS